jgi:hypothetical protein
MIKTKAPKKDLARRIFSHGFAVSVASLSLSSVACMPVFSSFAGRPAKLSSGAQTRGLSPNCQASAETTLDREPASILTSNLV